MATSPFSTARRFEGLGINIENLSCVADRGRARTNAFAFLGAFAPGLAECRQRFSCPVGIPGRIHEAGILEPGPCQALPFFEGVSGCYSLFEVGPQLKFFAIGNLAFACSIASWGLAAAISMMRDPLMLPPLM